MVEITNDLQLLPPIMLAVLLAKWTGDYFSPPLYDALLRVRFIPFLEYEPPRFMERMLACDLMASNVKCLPTEVEVGEILKVLHSCKHNGFPVVEGGPDGKGKQLRGLILRHQLETLIRDRVWTRERKFSALDFRLKSTVPSAPVADLKAKLTHEDLSMIISLEPFMNRSFFSIHHEFSAMHSFRLFRGLGLRHLPVVDYKNEVVGIITRKDLIEPVIEDKFEKVLHGGRRGSTIQPFASSSTTPTFSRHLPNIHNAV
jgi:chloride channel 7